MGMSTDGVGTTDLAETSALSPLGKNTQDIYQLSIENGYDRFRCGKPWANYQKIKWIKLLKAKFGWDKMHRKRLSRRIR